MSRKSGIKQLLTYLFKDEKKLEDRDHKPIVIRKNVRSRTLDKNIKEFEKNEALRIHKRVDGIKAYHTVISFNANDREHINEAVLKDIAKHYMNLRGKDAMYIATAHYDQKHIHIHIAESGTKFMTGKANRQSKQQFRELKVAIQTYQKEKYPQLKNSLPNHGKQSTKTYAERNGRNDRKVELQNAVKFAYEKAGNVNEFLNAIKQMGHEPYFRNEKLTGIKYDGEQKFRLSRLGYDNEKFHKLEEKEREETVQLEEMQSIRESSSSRDRETENRGRSIEDENEKDETENIEPEMDDEDNR